MGRTKEQVYREQMQALGIYEEIFEPEIRTLCRVERELTRAEKAWSKTAPPGGKPSFLDDHFAIVRSLRDEVLKHRDALGLTPKALRRITGVGGADAPETKELISEKLDRIAQRVAGYDAPGAGAEDPFADIPEAAAASEIGELLDGAAWGEPAGAPGKREGVELDEDLRRAVREDMG